MSASADALGFTANLMGSEKNAIARVRIELELRGWSQAELCRRMEKHASKSTGGTIHPAVLSKMLGGDRGRHLSIDQLVTLAAVFELTVAEMLLPPGAAEFLAALRALADGPDLQRAVILAQARLREAQEAIVQDMLESAYLRDHVADELEEEIAKAKSGGYPLGDSVRAAFLGGVIDRYNALKAEG